MENVKKLLPFLPVIVLIIGFVMGYAIYGHELKTVIKDVEKIEINNSSIIKDISEINGDIKVINNEMKHLNRSMEEVKVMIDRIPR